jgi:hypothetical protein
VRSPSFTLRGVACALRGALREAVKGSRVEGYFFNER